MDFQCRRVEKAGSVLLCVAERAGWHRSQRWNRFASKAKGAVTLVAGLAKACEKLPEGVVWHWAT